MKKLFITTILLLVTVLTNAQLIINTTQTPSQIVQNTLIGTGVSVSNIKFNGVSNPLTAKDQISSFSTGVNPTNIGMNQGVILATGKATAALGPNNSNSYTNQTTTPYTGDVDLAQLSTMSVANNAVLEFDFIPASQNISFNFVFASEEYPEYSTSPFNDVVGVFLSGPGIAGPFSLGAKNIATLPTSATSSIFVSLNNLNNGTTNVGPCVNCNYYINNIVNAQSTIQYDGFSTEIIANSPVQAGQTYHVKFAIANVIDNSFDSALFLKANSFASTSLNVIEFLDEKISFSPNPAKNNVTIKINRPNAKLNSVRVLNLLGKEVKFFKEINSNDFSMDVSNVSKGVYIVEIENSDSIKTTKKLIIE